MTEETSSFLLSLIITIWSEMFLFETSRTRKLLEDLIQRQTDSPGGVTFRWMVQMFFMFSCFLTLHSYVPLSLSVTFFRVRVLFPPLICRSIRPVKVGCCSSLIIFPFLYTTTYFSRSSVLLQCRVMKFWGTSHMIVTSPPGAAVMFLGAAGTKLEMNAHVSASVHAEFGLRV